MFYFSKQLIALLVLLFSIAGTTASAEDGWPGYKPTQDIDLPFAEVAKSHVFSLETAVYLPEDGEIEILITADQPKVTKRMFKKDDLRALQLATCQMQGLERCPILKHRYTGTAFADGTDLYTCRHMVDQWVQTAAEANGLSPLAIAPLARLRNTENTVVYDSSVGPQLHFVTYNDDPRIPLLNGESALDPKKDILDLAYVLSDFALIRSANPLSTTPLNIPDWLHGTDWPTVGYRVYVSGYPRRTNLFDGSGDTKGGTLVTSTGTITGVNRVQQLFVSTALATGGMSGGMVTNENGDAFGMACSGHRDEVLGDPQSSRGQFLDPSGMKVLWFQIRETLDEKLPPAQNP